MWARVHFTRDSLRTANFTAAEFAALINNERDHFDGWIPSRPESQERLLKFFFQQLHVLQDVNEALVACRDLARDAAVLAPNLAPIHTRLRKARSADPDADLDKYYELIDSFCIPSGAAAIELHLESRRFKCGEESVADYFDALISLCDGHMDHDRVRRKFLTSVSLALDDAEKAGTFPESYISDVRDNFLADESSLPRTNDELLQKLRKRTSTKSPWSRAPGPPADKRARSFLGLPDSVQQPPPPSAPYQYAPPPPQQLLPPQHPSAPPPPPPPPAPFQQGGSDPNTATANYGKPGPGADRFNGGGYGGRGSGYGGGRGGYPPSKGKGDGKGGKRIKDPSELTRFYPIPHIISTGKIWPADTKLLWDNPRRINADGTGDGLYGMDCPLCGEGRTEEYSYEEYTAKFGGVPTNTPGGVPQPAHIALFHRGLGCKAAGWRIQRHCLSNPEDRSAFDRYMTEGELAEFKASCMRTGA